MSDAQIRPDEVEAPTHIGARQPWLRAPWPLDLSFKEAMLAVAAMAISFMFLGDTTTDTDWFMIGACMVGTVGGIVLWRLVKPSPIFWLIMIVRYVLVVLLTFPIWFRPSLPFRRLSSKANNDWPAMYLPRWLVNATFSNVLINDDGTIYVKNEKDPFGAVIEIDPLADASLQPESERAARLSKHKELLISIPWSQHWYIRVRPADVDKLAQAAGRFNEDWIRTEHAETLIQRHALVIMRAPSLEELKERTVDVIERFNDAKLNARRLSKRMVKRMLADVWDSDADGPLVSRNRVRMAINRVLCGRRLWTTRVVTMVPRLLHYDWPYRFTSGAVHGDVSLHIHRRADGPAMRSMERLMVAWGASGRSHFSRALSDAQRIHVGMQRGQNSTAEISMAISVPYDQRRDLTNALDSSRVQHMSAALFQDIARRDTLPIGSDQAGVRMPLDIHTAAATDITATAGYQAEDGTLIGHGLWVREPVTINFGDERLLGPTFFIAAVMGAGKSLLAMMLAWRQIFPHHDHPLFGTGIQLIAIEHKLECDYLPLFQQLEAHGAKAAYHQWSADEPLPALDRHIGFNLAQVPPDRQGQVTADLMSSIRDHRSKGMSKDVPLLLLIDEAGILADFREGQQMLKTFGAQSRSANIHTGFMSQQIPKILKNDDAAASFENASTIFLGRQNDAGVASMQQRIYLDPQISGILQTLPDGGFVMKVERRDCSQTIGIRTAPSPWEKAAFGTQPHEQRARRTRVTQKTEGRNGLVRV